MSPKKKNKKKRDQATTDDAEVTPKKKISRKEFDRELRKLQVELCHLQEWVKRKGLRIVVVFEGRDAAGKGGVIKRITERVNPRVFRVVALPTPSDREKSQIYIQRYLNHFPAAGEVILFDRSWYNRAGVEKVMGFCTDDEYERFLESCPGFEKQIIETGIILVKYFFDVSREQQEKRFKARITDPMRHWKLSPMDVESWRRWWQYTEAYHRMLATTDTPWAPWIRVPANDKRRARLNCINHLLSVVPYKKQRFTPPKVDKRLPRPKGVSEQLTFRQEVPQVF
jgi:polyphosphate kinase 2